MLTCCGVRLIHEFTRRGSRLGLWPGSGPAMSKRKLVRSRLSLSSMGHTSTIVNFHAIATITLESAHDLILRAVAASCHNLHTFSSYLRS